MIDGKIEYVSLTMLSTMAKFQPHKRKLSVYEIAESLKDKINENAPGGLGDVVQTTEMDWGWMDVERLIVLTFYQGLALCFPMCFFVLLAASQNIIISVT